MCGKLDAKIVTFIIAICAALCNTEADDANSSGTELASQIPSCARYGSQEHVEHGSILAGRSGQLESSRAILQAVN
jgi:hypothetical protein